MNELNHVVKPKFKKWLIVFISSFAALLFLASLSKAQTVHSFMQRNSWEGQYAIRMTSSDIFIDSTEVSPERFLFNSSQDVQAGRGYADHDSVTTLSVHR